MRWLRADSVWIVAASLGVAAIGFAGPAAASGRAPGAGILLAALAGGPSIVLALVLLRLRPHNRIGHLLALAGIVALGVAGAENYVQVAGQLYLSGGGSLPVAGAAVALLQGDWMLYYLPWAWLLLVFPTGTLSGRLDRWLAAALAAIVVLFCALAALGPVDSPLPQAARAQPLFPGADLLSVPLLPLFLAALLACPFRFRARYRRAPAAQRLQMRWLAAAGALVPATLLLCWLSSLLLHTSEAVVVGLALIYVLVPAAVAVAVLRAELFDVDRAMAAGLVAAGLGFAALAVLSGAVGLLAAATGRRSAVLAALLTVVLVLVLVPVHKRLVKVVDRWLYPGRWRVLEALAVLDSDVQAGTARPEALEERLREALGRPALVLGYLLPGTGTMVAGGGEPLVLGPAATTVTMAGSTVGIVDWTPECPRGPDGTAGPAGPGALPLDRDVLAVLARSMLLVSLRLELGQALEEVAASRSRILSASYVARQRLERDLHDGAQQRLVALGMALRLAQRHLPQDQHRLNDVLDGAVAELGTAVAEIRQLAHGVRPSSLDAGLPVALEQLCTTAPFPVDLHVRQGGSAAIPDSVGTTAYFVASEAVANAAKYAMASRIVVSLDHDGHCLRIGVADDGGGGAVLRRGGGLAGLADRVGALGGSMNVTSRAGHGTLVEAQLPCV